MNYSVYLDGVLLPVTPAVIKIKYKSSNETMRLIDGGEATFLRKGEAAIINFDMLLPRHVYPFCRYVSGFVEPEYYLNTLMAIRNERRPFRFICTRAAGDGTYLYDTNIRVSLEDMTVREDADEGADIIVSVELKEYQSYSASRVVIEKTVAAVEDNSRETDNAPSATAYTVVKGDSLWNIAKKYLGDGSRWSEIYELNKGQISSPNSIYPGQVLVLPS